MNNGCTFNHGQLCLRTFIIKRKSIHDTCQKVLLIRPTFFEKKTSFFIHEPAKYFRENPYFVVTLVKYSQKEFVLLPKLTVVEEIWKKLDNMHRLDKSFAKNSNRENSGEKTFEKITCFGMIIC